jgi:NADH dehydrogenase
VDRTNHHVFQPLLYQVATANLAPSDIATPIRHALRDQENTTVLLAEAIRVELAARRVLIGDGRPPLSYDYLIVATGSRHAYFGHDEWERAAPGLKTIEDALTIRHRLLAAFERAELEPDAARAAELLTFVVVGGGPTGVELAGMIPEIARGTLKGQFRRIDPRRARVILVEAGTRLLPSMPAALGDHARRDLEAVGVEVRLGAEVTTASDDGVLLGDECIRARTVLWAAGNQASPLGVSLCRQSGLVADRVGRVPVSPDLTLPGHPEVFIVGDLALVERTRGAPAPGAPGATVPAVAPAAMQEGRHAGASVARRVAGKPTRDFVYVDKGELATIGKHRAVASLFGGRLRVHGWVAWWFWLALHLFYLIGFRNRLSVLLQWSYAYLFAGRGARLIVGRVQAGDRPPTDGPSQPEQLGHRSAA